MAQKVQRGTSNINALTFAQYIAAILVVVLHSGKFLEHSELNFFIKNIICRLAVPLFMVITSYFYRLNEQKSAGYSKLYFKRQIKTYFFWSMVYLPVGCFYLWQHNYEWFTYPVALLIGLFYFGTWYHLWYIPALLFGIWLTSYLLKRFRYIWVILSASLLYIVGSVETYSAYLDHTIIGNLYNQYASLFITTRNGLFFAFIFVIVGFVLADFKDQPFIYERGLWKTLISFSFLCLEGWFIFHNPGYDKNFMIGLVPVSLFLVAALLKTKAGMNNQLQCHYLREQGRYLFFLHPIVLVAIQGLATNINGSVFQGIPLFLSTVLVTTLIANGMLQIKSIYGKGI